MKSIKNIGQSECVLSSIRIKPDITSLCKSGSWCYLALRLYYICHTQLTLKLCITTIPRKNSLNGKNFGTCKNHLDKFITQNNVNFCESALKQNGTEWIYEYLKIFFEIYLKTLLSFGQAPNLKICSIWFY